MEGLKTYNVQAPNASTVIRTAAPPGQRSMVSPAERADFFFKGHRVETPGSGSLMMKGNRKVGGAKRRRK